MNYYTPSLLLGPKVDVQDLLEKATAACARTSSQDGEKILAALRDGDQAAHSAFRYALAQGFCRYLAKLGPAFRALYIYGSTMNGGAHPASDVDVILWVHKKTDSIESLLHRLDRLLTQGYRALVGAYAPERLFDLHLVDDVDVEWRRGYGAVIQSLWTAPVCLWRH